MQAGQCGTMPGRGGDIDLAQALYRQTRDMVDAVAMARFFGWALDQAEKWELVRTTLSGMKVAPESTGVENWS